MLPENAGMRSSLRSGVRPSSAAVRGPATHRLGRSPAPIQTKLELAPPPAPRAAQTVPRSTSKILRLPQVCELIGLKKTMIYQMEAEARFPKRVKIGARAVGWLDDEIIAWLADRIAARK